MKTLTPEIIHVEQAKKFMQTYSEKGYGQNVLGVSHEEYIDFIFIGKLCEIVFIMKLKELNVALMADDLLIPAAGDHRKGADLILTKTNQSVDIKAGHKDFHTRLLVREDQFLAHKHDLYVGAKYVSNERIDYYGYATKAMLSSVQPKDFGHGSCRHLLLSELSSIDDFVKKARLGEVIR
jgi:hypothetical protein